MPHLIPIELIEKISKGPSDTKIESVSNLQNYIQDLLGDSHHTFLQGSYRNHTAISDINDVDIVAVRKSTYSGTHSPHKFDSVIFWDQIFSEVENKLNNQNKYNWQITRDSKCIKISGAFSVDVVPAVKIDHDESEDPICIHSFKDGKEMASYPRTHIKNGESKHSSTNNNFKPLVRMFKNWKFNHFGDEKIISSHRIESLVHSCTNDAFKNDRALSFTLVGKQIFDKLNLSVVLPSNICSVCGYENVINNWDITDKKRFNDQLIKSLGYVVKAISAQNLSEAETNWKLAFNI
ncbi:MAG: hypothetical protein US42_C0003G0062 [Candidatus Magasanikbacteria bacterium GW2011_GWC2_37_14]|uniref:cGAS/DncV-like nucleotidyltransferase C-terminal helical domain-containing protein n=1 Tax=Candidatus Magasanikbacteria bacterium GW2011_GWC2_37_14 TaxID=1619046 RepID=A0A0G0GPB4_9BACT|nr:MAG: hypothetical protein US42_C0003G0062 [Candidatus Magasanikbacteria bacterium GW2011_GWC2_37_14]